MNTNCPQFPSQVGFGGLSLLHEHVSKLWVNQSTVLAFEFGEIRCSLRIAIQPTRIECAFV
jgi:hypothetical protein